MIRRRAAARTAVATAALVASAILAGGGPVATAAPGGAAPVTASTPDGEWRVQGDAGGYAATFVADRPLPVTGARPEVLLDGVPVGPALVAPDRRTLTLAEPLAQRPDPARLDVVLSGVRLDDGSRVGAPGGGGAGSAGAVRSRGPVLPDDPAAPGPYDVAVRNYQRADITADGLPDVETVGHVEAPAASTPLDGAAPVVLFLHGRHDYCYDPEQQTTSYKWPCRGGDVPVPSQLGYRYVQRVLASQGFLTISIAANGINAQDGGLPDGGAQARAELVEHHLRLLAEGRLDRYLGGVEPDLSRLVLVGHSRGGEGVNRVSEIDDAGTPWDVVGQVLIGPVDFARQTTPRVPTVTMLPYCDGDVSDLQGQLYTDLARDLVPDDPSVHSSVLVMGANHNYFNTEWTPGLSAAPSIDDASYINRGFCDGDDADSGRLTPGEQQRVGKAYVAGAARWFTGEDEFAPMFDGTGARAPSTQTLGIRSHAVGGRRDVVRPGDDATASAAGGASAVVCSGYDQACRGNTGIASPHFAERYLGEVPTNPAVRFSWTASGQRGGLSLNDPVDLGGDDHLDLRVLLVPGTGSASFDVRLDDGTDAAVITPQGAGMVAVLPQKRYGAAAVAQTLRLDLDDAAAAGVDLGQVEGIELVSRTDEGTAWLLDFIFGDILRN